MISSKKEKSTRHEEDPPVRAPDTGSQRGTWEDNSLAGQEWVRPDGAGLQEVKGMKDEVEDELLVVYGGEIISTGLCSTPQSRLENVR